MIEIVYLSVHVLMTNTWNPNRMTDEMLRKEIESIKEFGFVDPITVRYTGVSGYEIIDGEQRWRAAKDENYDEVDVANLGEVDDQTAKKLTIVLNELRGNYDPRMMGHLLTDLLILEPLPQLIAILPFEKAQFEELAQLPSIDWNQVVPATPRVSTRTAEMTERVYRMPTEAAETIDRAIAEMRTDDPHLKDWEVLQRLAEEYLG